MNIEIERTTPRRNCRVELTHLDLFELVGAPPDAQIMQLTKVSNGDIEKFVIHWTEEVEEK